MQPILFLPSARPSMIARPPSSQGTTHALIPHSGAFFPRVFCVCGSLDLSDVTMRSAIDDHPKLRHLDALHVASADAIYVHLPADANAPELMRARLRAIDQGSRFRKRVMKQPKAKPVERFTPIVSDRVVEAHEEV